MLGSFNKEPGFVFPERKKYLQFYSNMIQKKYKIDSKTSKYLVKTYGDRAFDLLKLSVNSPKLLEKIHENHNFIKAEIVY